MLSLASMADAAGSAVTYQVDGQPFEGYYLSPAAEAPLVLLIHDWDGLGDYERRRARMLADAGYAVFAADLFGSGIRPATIEERRRLTGELYQDREKMRKRMVGALEAARAQGARIDDAVAMGYCFGGTAVLELARSGADLKGFVSFHGGLVNNIIPGEVTIHGTVRTFNPETQDIVASRMADIIHHMGALYGAGCTLDYHKHFPPTINHPRAVDKFEAFLTQKGMAGTIHRLTKPSMGAEDFSYFLQEKPGAFIFVGTRNEEKGILHEIHHPEFDIDEDILLETALTFAEFFAFSD